MSCTLSLNNISCCLGDRTLFRNVTINLTHKDKIAVLGPNGAGKTTLLKAIVGLQTISTGHFEIHHKPVHHQLFLDPELFWQQV